MAKILKHVQPGDLFTADMWNELVDAVNDLLDSNQNLTINVAAISPSGTPADPLRIGTPVQITGQNFGYSGGLAKVIFTGGPGGDVTLGVPNFTSPGSSDTRLLFIMPPIPGITQAGATLTMKVDNGLAHDILSVFVQPLVIDLSGSVFVTWRGDPTAAPNPNPNPVKIGGGAEFKYQIRTAGLNMAASFTLSAKVADATVAIPASMNDGIQIQDDRTGGLINNKSLDMKQNDAVNVTVRLPTLPDAWKQQSFTLEVTATSGQVTNTDRRSFTEGSDVQSSNDVSVEQLNPQVFLAAPPHTEDTSQTNGKLVGSTVSLKAGWLMDIPSNITFNVDGNYTFSAAAKTGTTLNGWTVSLVNTSASLNNVKKGDTTQATVEITAPASATAPGIATSGTVVFSITRSGGVPWTQEYAVQLMQ